MDSFRLVDDATPLTCVPMIMAHDAGTGYLGDGLVNRWAKTQSVGLADQLSCGARVFDARPRFLHGQIIWHHGSVAAPYSFSHSVADIVSWLSEHPTELVILPISNCDGGDRCLQGVRAAFAEHNVSDVADCRLLSGLTLGGTKMLAALPRGGALLGVTGATKHYGTACSVGNYDPTIACTSALSSALTGNRTVTPPGEENLDRADSSDAMTLSQSGSDGFGCWMTDPQRTIPVGRMLRYLDRVASMPLSPGSFTQSQALWQESVESVVIGTLRNSSLLLDEQNSRLNQLIRQQVLARRWPHMNLLEVNNVCDGGQELWSALKHVYYARNVAE